MCPFQDTDFSDTLLARLYPIFENLLKADLSNFISVEMSLLRVFKHRFFSLMFENSGAKSASASLLLTLLFFKMDKVELNFLLFTFYFLLFKFFAGKFFIYENRHLEC